MSLTVEVVYRGRARRLLIAGPSGAPYEFIRDVPVAVKTKDAEWFCSDPAWSHLFETIKKSPPAVEPVIPVPVVKKSSDEEKPAPTDESRS